MADKELRRLSRKQLLELLHKLTERSESLQAQLDEANKKLKNKLVIKSEAGSIAEAALKLNGVFEAAEDAAKQYLYNVKKISENQDLVRKRFEEECIKRARAMFEEADKVCKSREVEARKKAERIIAEAEERSRKIDEEAEKKISELRQLYKYVMEAKKKAEKSE